VTPTHQSPKRRVGLLRALGVTDATLLVMGCIIGVGIFRSASSIAAYVPNASVILALWVIGGVISLCGALCYAELAAAFPTSGGDYVYLTRTYGRFWGFLFGWTKLFIERTGTIAILGTVFAEYASRVVPYGATGVRWAAAGAIIGLTLVNILGVRWGTYVQNLFAILKIAALGALIAAGLWACVTGAGVAPAWVAPTVDAALLPSMGVAFAFILWTYGGWTEAAYVAEEVREPTRNVPRAILLGLTLVGILYVLVTWSYLLFVPADRLAGTPLVASAVMSAVWGDAGATFIAWMIACSAFGALNGYILTGARILYAIGRDHRFFARLGVVHPTFRTPAIALGVNAAVAIGLVFTKTFEQIVTYSTVVISVFFVMAVLGLIVLRRTQPTLPRPYRAWGYPVTPLLFAVVLIGFVVDVCIKQPAESIFGFGLLALGLPLYWGSGGRHGSAGDDGPRRP